MIVNKKPNPPEAAKQHDFWASYSDLLAGMLLVFTLLLIVAMLHYAEFNRKKIEAQETRLKMFKLLQMRLIEDLESAFENETVTIDPKTGVLQIGSGILFGEGESQLRPEGKARLKGIFNAYIQVILNEEFKDFIKQIEIEGHTNTNGTYLYNLELSQQRALAVMKVFLEHAGNNQGRLQEIVFAGGRSYSHLVLDESGNEDKVRSRRIEIKFRLKEDELFSDIYQDLTR